MAGIMPILAGLGQAAQNYQQQRDAGLRNAMLQLYLQNQKREQGANSLLGGLNLDSLSQGLNLPGTTMPPQQAPQAPMVPPPGQPQAGPPPPMPPAVGRGTLVAPDPGITQQNTMPNAGMPVTGPPGHGVGTAVPPPPLGEEDATSVTAGHPINAPPAEAEAPAATAGMPPASAGDTAPPEKLAEAAGSEGGLVAHLPGGGSVPIDKLMGHRVSLSDVQRLIREQKPGLDPETAWLATEKLFKLVNQDNVQSRMYGLGVLKELGVISGLGLRAQTLENTQRHQQVMEGQGEKRIGLSGERVKQGAARIDLQREALVDRKAARAMQLGNAGVRAQVQQLMDRRRTILEASRSDPLHQVSEAEVKQLQELDKQIEALHGKLAGAAGATPLAGP